MIERPASGRLPRVADADSSPAKKPTACPSRGTERREYAGVLGLVPRLLSGCILVLLVAPSAPGHAQRTSPGVALLEYDVPRGAHPHDVAPARDGSVWYTAQHQAALGRLDPETGEALQVPLGPGSRPHGVIVGPDGSAWVTDSGLNALVRVASPDLKVTRFPLPASAGNANLNTATFAGDGILWFTGQSGIYGRMAPNADVEVEMFSAPRRRGPYGITTTPSSDVYFASLAGSYVGAIDVATSRVTVLEPPTPRQGSRRIWSDSHGRLWVTGWNVGLLMSHDPETGVWREWRMPGSSRPYAVYVDEGDTVWVSDFGTNSIVRFDPTTERFQSFELPTPNARVRQLLGRPGEVWGAESAADKLVVLRY